MLTAGSGQGAFTLPPDLPARLDPIAFTRDELEQLPAWARRLRPAAVVALLLPGSPERPEVDPRLVLIERSPFLRSHAGQLAFPGGKPEPHDGSLVETALREAEEEVALPPAKVRVLGRLTSVPTPTGFLITPFVAWVEMPWEPRPDPTEVHRALTPKLADLADPGIHRIAGVRTYEGLTYELHEFSIGSPPLWGATARMVWDLLERVRAA